MKRTISIFSIFLLLAVSSNVAITFSYCCGKFYSADFLSVKKNKCTKACCEKTTKVFKADDFNKTSAEFSFVKQAPILHSFTEISFESPVVKKTIFYSTASNAPPYSKEPFYILYNNLVI